MAYQYNCSYQNTPYWSCEYGVGTNGSYVLLNPSVNRKYLMNSSFYSGPITFGATQDRNEFFLMTSNSSVVGYARYDEKNMLLSIDLLNKQKGERLSSNIFSLNGGFSGGKSISLNSSGNTKDINVSIVPM